MQTSNQFLGEFMKAAEADLEVVSRMANEITEKMFFKIIDEGFKSMRDQGKFKNNGMAYMQLYLELSWRFYTMISWQLAQQEKVPREHMRTMLKDYLKEFVSRAEAQMGETFDIACDSMTIAKSKDVPDNQKQ